MEPCKHLDYEEKYINCTLIELPGFSCPVKHWRRDNPPYEGAPINVQFCKLRGRINDILSCYNEGERSCYETEEVPDDDKA